MALERLFRRKRPSGGNRDVPELWTKCEACGAQIYKKEFQENLHVCPKCGHHHRLPAVPLLEADGLLHRVLVHLVQDHRGPGEVHAIPLDPELALAVGHLPDHRHELHSSPPHSARMCLAMMSLWISLVPS